ncbi:hypothetical protein V8G54_035927, partial [Vigna mungo]
EDEIIQKDLTSSQTPYNGLSLQQLKPVTPPQHRRHTTRAPSSHRHNTATTPPQNPQIGTNDQPPQPTKQRHRTYHPTHKPPSMDQPSNGDDNTQRYFTARAQWSRKGKGSWRRWQREGNWGNSE